MSSVNSQGPEVVTVVTVQLVFSDSGVPRFRESFHEFYSIALLPFVLDIPDDQVTLVLRKKLTEFTDSTIDEEHNVTAVDGTPLFPNDYKEYFKRVYRNRNVRLLDVEDEGDLTLPECTIRVISGHGHGNYCGGNITIGRKIVPWPALRALPSCLTVLNICSAAYAVASFEGETLSKEKRHKFDEMNFFDLDNLAVPVICHKNRGTYSFRVGYEGQSSSADPETVTSRMTRAVGDPVTSALLYAIKQFTDHDGANRLDELFCTCFSTIAL